jgi:hypothetical protein
VYKTWRDWFLCFIIFNVFLDVWNSTVLFFILHVWGVIQKLEVWVTGYNFESWPFKDHSRHVCFKLAYWFQRKFFLNIFPIGSYVKTMSADCNQLGWRSGSQDIILKVDHLRTIHAMFVMFIGWSYTRILFLALIRNPTWLPGPIMCSEILKIFLLETTKPIELWLYRNEHWVVLY